MLIRKFTLPEINWEPQEEACATPLVQDILHRARSGSLAEALTSGTAALGFDSYVFGIVANDRRPDSDSRTYVVTNQSEAWLTTYDEGGFLDLDPRIEMAQEPGYTYWEAKQFGTNHRNRMFLGEAAPYGIRSGLVLGLCTRDPPSYAMLALNRKSPSVEDLSAERRLMIAGQALLLGKVLSRSIRESMYKDELLFPAPRMKLDEREREILTFIAHGMTSKEIASALGIAKVTVDMQVGLILQKLGALNRNQAIAKAVRHRLIDIHDGASTEFKSAKLHAIRRPKGKPPR